MASSVQLLQLSPTMTDGTIVKWLVKEGDAVSAGDPIAEVETDKAVMEQEAFEDGMILKIVIPQGQSIPVGSQIAVIGQKGEDISGLLSGGAAPAKAEESKPAEAPASKEEPKAPAPAPAAPEATPTAAPKSEGGRVLASPLARKMAKEHGLDLASIAGSGPGGRIVKRDIEAAQAAPKARAAAPAAAAVPSAGDETLTVSGMRKTIARRLVESRQQIPSFSVSMEVDAQPVLDAVARLRSHELPEKITVTHVLIKAMASTIMRHPWIRTQWVGNGQMVRKNAAHISVAVAIEDGLLTPVMRDVQAKGFVQIARELRELADLARARKLTEEQLSGGVQTLSNLGMYGVSSFDAIINPPESSILAIGAIEEKAVVRDGALVPGKVMTLTISADHRVVDGAVAASYLKDLKATIEDPLMMLA